MPPAIIGGAIAAVGALGAAKIGSSSANKASQTQAAGNQAAIASQERGRAESNAALAPWQQSGLQANSLLQSALGYGGISQPSQSLPTQQPMQAMQMGGGQNALMQSKPWLSSGFGGSGTQFAEQGYAPQQVTAPQQTARAGGNSNAMNAFDTFLNSTNYQWQRDQGMDALNSGYAGAGVLQSGAAIQGAIDYNQNMARGAFQDWYGGVENMANRGFGAASAQAGVSQNIANNVSNLNSANAQNQASMQIAKGNMLANTIGGIGAIGANVLGGVIGQQQQSNALVAPSASYPMSGAYVRQF